MRKVELSDMFYLLDFDTESKDSTLFLTSKDYSKDELLFEERLDVSCGSGVFLVTVFKRLVQWWQKEQYDQTGLIEHPTVEILKEILLNSVYGVDIEADSVRLSVFSLSIALCDMLKPTEIWTELRFEDLKEKNICTGNFFKYLNKEEKG